MPQPALLPCAHVRTSCHGILRRSCTRPHGCMCRIQSRICLRLLTLHGNAEVNNRARSDRRVTSERVTCNKRVTSDTRLPGHVRSHRMPAYPCSHKHDSSPCIEVHRPLPEHALFSPQGPVARRKGPVAGSREPSRPCSEIYSSSNQHETFNTLLFQAVWRPARTQPIRT